MAVAVTDGARATRDIWMYNIGSGERTQFTSEPSDENWLIWSPDGARVLLNSFARDRLTLFEAPSSGASQRTQVLEGNEGKWPVSWSPDGRFVLYVTNNDRTSNDIWVLLRDGSGSHRIRTFTPQRPRTGLRSRRMASGSSSARLIPIPVSPKCSSHHFQHRRDGSGSRRTVVRRRAGGEMGKRSFTSRRIAC